MLRERLGKLHFVLMVIGANTTFIPFFFLGYDGMPRWMASYPAGAGFTTLSLISSIGAGIIGLAMLVFAYNLYISARVRVPRRPTPGRGTRWSGPPLPRRRRYNFDLAHPVPRVRSYAPLLDLREQARAAPGTAEGNEMERLFSAPWWSPCGGR